jgi:hypothetical protein
MEYSVWTAIPCVKILWFSYVGPNSAGSISYGKAAFYAAKEGLMLDLLLGGGFLLFCLYVAHERLRNRI